jgi:hypothetical protein
VVKVIDTALIFLRLYSKGLGPRFRLPCLGHSVAEAYLGGQPGALASEAVKEVDEEIKQEMDGGWADKALDDRK